MHLGPGTQKIAVGRKRGGDEDYAQQKAAALAAVQHMGHAMGVQHVKDIGSGQFSKDSRDPLYGNANVTMQRMRDGNAGNFSQPDHPGNAAPADPLNQTGFQRTGVSSTAVPQQDPEVFEASAVEKRLAMYANLIPQSAANLNDLGAIYG